MGNNLILKKFENFCGDYEEDNHAISLSSSNAFRNDLFQSNENLKENNSEFIKENNNNYNLKTVIFLQSYIRYFLVRIKFIKTLKKELLLKGKFITLSEMLIEIPLKIRQNHLSIINNLKNDGVNPFLFKNKKTIYFGKFSYRNELTGTGILSVKNNFVYIGDFLDNKITGKGKIYYNKNDSYYKGDFLNGLRHGFGAFYFQGKDNNYQIYEGNFINNKFNGKGRLMKIINNEKIIYYIGDFVNNQFCGKGEFTYDNNDKYIGSFQNNKKNGYGKYYYYDKNDNKYNYIYEGLWENDIQNGEGTFLFNKEQKFQCFVNFKDGILTEMKQNE